ncbi:MAG: hypothetical protein PVH25_13430 [Burkholderiales bacterium]|jgi:hypothetical protein
MQIQKLQGLTFAGTTALYFVGFGLFGAFGIIGWQMLGWLRTGEWHTLTLTMGLATFGVKWAASPRSWIGIYNMLEHVPLSVAVFWAWMIPALLLMLLHNRLVRSR